MIGYASTPNRRHRLAATNDREPVTTGNGMGHRDGPSVKGGLLEDPHRAVPENGLGSFEDFADRCAGLLPDVDSLESRGDLVRTHGLGRLRVVQIVCHHQVRRQDDLDLGLPGAVQDVSSHVELVVLDEPTSALDPELVGAVGGTSDDQDAVDDQ